MFEVGVAKVVKYAGAFTVNTLDTSFQKYEYFKDFVSDTRKYLGMSLQLRSKCENPVHTGSYGYNPSPTSLGHLTKFSDV